MARLSVIPQEPTIGRHRADLVRAGVHTAAYPLHPAADFERTAFFFPDTPQAGVGHCGHNMVDPAFRHYRSHPVVAHAFADVYALGVDGVLLTADGVMSNTLQWVGTWHADCCVAQVRGSDYLKLRAPMPVTSFIEHGHHLIRFGPAWRNYGHWLLQCLPKIHAFMRLRRQIPDLKLVLPRLVPGSPQQRTLDLLRTPPDALVQLDAKSVTGFASAILLPDFSIWDIDDFVCAAVEALIAGAPEAVGGPSLPEKVYIHRTVNARHVANFPAVREVVEQHGFVVRSFETADLADQIRTMRAARAVITEHGANSTNILFCQPGARVLETFNPYSVDPTFWSIASRRGLKYGYIVGDHSPTETHSRPNWNTRYDVPLDTLRQGIAVLERLPAPPVGRATGGVATPTPPSRTADAASGPAGMLEPVYESITTLDRFGATGGHACLSVFAPLTSGAQLPLHREAEMPRDFVADHNDYGTPDQVSVYALAGAALWGHGIVVADGRFVAPADVMPGYFRSHFRIGGPPLHPSHSGALGRPDAEAVHVAHPIASAMHPNLLFGHFLLEVLPRLYLLAVLRDYGAAFPLALSGGLPAWVKAWVGLLHSDENIIWYDGARQYVTAPSVILPSMLHSDNNFHPALNLMVRDLTQRVAALPASSLALPSKVFLAHGHFGGEKLDNAAEAERALVELGFAVIRPGDLTPDALIRTFAAARIVVAEYGHGLLAALFAPPGTRIVAINFANNALSKVARLRGLRLAFVPPADGQYRHWRLSNALPARFRVDVARLRQTVIEMLGRT